jgi:hypothetical protein
MYPRWYFFSHDLDASSEGRFGDGWLYILARDGFEAEAPEFGVFDTAHFVSLTAVTPLAVVPVTASDFPFTNYVVPHRVETLLRAARSERRRRRV